jgi:hypothetical protein
MIRRFIASLCVTIALLFAAIAAVSYRTPIRGEVGLPDRDLMEFTLANATLTFESRRRAPAILSGRVGAMRTIAVAGFRWESGMLPLSRYKPGPTPTPTPRAPRPLVVLNDLRSAEPTYAAGPGVVPEWELANFRTAQRQRDAMTGALPHRYGEASILRSTRQMDAMTSALARHLDQVTQVIAQTLIKPAPSPFTTIPASPYYRVSLGLWLLCVLVGMYPLLFLVYPGIRRWRRKRRGLCATCAYDLTGNTSGVCPECGREI